MATNGKNEQAKNGADERLVPKTPGIEDGMNERLGRDQEDLSKIVGDGTALSLDERIKLIREQWDQEILPKPPVIPGWHCCWLSTTNQTDSIHSRMRIGYRPVMLSEAPGFQQYAVNGGDFDGNIACNEMVLFKIEEEVFQAIMQMMHHERPLEMETEIRLKLDEAAAKDRKGRVLVETEGFDVLGQRVQPPQSFESR